MKSAKKKKTTKKFIKTVEQRKGSKKNYKNKCPNDLKIMIEKLNSNSNSDLVLVVVVFGTFSMFCHSGIIRVIIIRIGK